MNKPVAWISRLPEGDVYNCAWAEKQNDDDIPLYTHPVNAKYDPETGEPLIDGYPLFSGLPHPVKELTDEEIIAEAEKFGVIIADTGLKAIKAILRKGQEK